MLFRNVGSVPLSVPGAGQALPGQTLEVPEPLADGLCGPEWQREQPAAASKPEATPVHEED